jgi:hypothetical protein
MACSVWKSSEREVVLSPVFVCIMAPVCAGTFIRLQAVEQ